jgi:hypothetical protein
MNIVLRVAVRLPITIAIFAQAHQQHFLSIRKTTTTESKSCDPSPRHWHARQESPLTGQRGKEWTIAE